MIDFSYKGLIVSLLIFIPEAVHFFLSIKKQKGKKFLKVLELVLGLLIAVDLSMVIFNIGFKFSNLTFFIIWLCVFAILIFLFYTLWIKYYIGGRNENILKKKMVYIPYPDAVLSSLLYGITACFTLNYVMLFLSLLYSVVKVVVAIDETEVNE